MIISKAKGEKLVDNDMKDVYGGYSCNDCGDCNCRSSGGDKFYSTFEIEQIAFEISFHS